MFWVEQQAPIFRYPRCIYNDNGSHFVGSKVATLFKRHVTLQISAPISHPSSVGLIERNVQFVTSQVRKWVLERGPRAKTYWGRAIPAILPMINGRLVRLHGFTPAEIFLEYTPEWIRPDPASDALSEPLNDPSTEQINHYVARRDESRASAVKRITTNNTQMEEQARAQWEAPQAGDLVLVRDFARDKH